MTVTFTRDVVGKVDANDVDVNDYVERRFHILCANIAMLYTQDVDRIIERLIDTMKHELYIHDFLSSFQHEPLDRGENEIIVEFANNTSKSYSFTL